MISNVATLKFPVLDVLFLNSNVPAQFAAAGDVRPDIGGLNVEDVSTSVRIPLYGKPRPGKKFGDVVDYALVDVVDVPELNKCRWQINSGGYARNGRGLRMHRVIMGVTDPGVLIDHINGNRLDNRRINLRLCTRAQNQKNMTVTRSGTGFKGIHRTRHGTYAAQIMSDGKRLHLGCHETPEDAARAYDEAAKQLHGEFAFLNFPDARGEGV